MRVAAIDCGTNSVRLLIADVAGGRLTDVVRELRVVRLGEGVDANGRLAPDAIERTRLALRDYADVIAAHNVVRTRMVATSATRDAANRDDFVVMVRSVLGLEPDVIEGAEEARLSFTGAADVVPPGATGVVVADIGGGSTELVRDASDARSLQVGCVRLTERHLHDDPPTAAQVEAVTADVRTALGSVVPAGLLVGVAGTVTTVAAIALGLSRYDSAVIHGSVLTGAQIDEVTEALLGMTRDERAALPVMHPGRVDVIVAGALILRTLMSAFGADEITVSEHDILDGIALAISLRPAAP